MHRGHARIIDGLEELARQVGGPAIVFTFDPHPVRLLRPDAAPPLTWTDRKAELLAELGIDAMIAYPTDEALLGLTPAEFFDEIVLRQLDARSLVEGPNFHFGRGRAGKIELLKQLTERAGMLLKIVEPLVLSRASGVEFAGPRLVAAGSVEAARDCSTEPYRLRGMVVHGAGRGAKIGFPTANVDAIDTMLPGAGVYAGRGLCGRRCVARGDQCRAQSDLRRTCNEGRNSRDRLARCTLSSAAGG